jgi:hypothetical protein
MRPQRAIRQLQKYISVLINNVPPNPNLDMFAHLCNESIKHQKSTLISTSPENIDIDKYIEFMKNMSDAYIKGIHEVWLGTPECEQKIRILKQEYEQLSIRYGNLETSRENDIRDAVELSKTTKTELAYIRLNDMVSKQSEEISKLSNVLIRRSINIKTKGSDYEFEFGEKLRCNYGLCQGFILSNTSGIGHEMDFSMQMEGHMVIWELKHYTTGVPKLEVEKFLRDLKTSPSKIGVMISRSSHIYGKHGNICTEFENDKMMIYIGKFEEFCGYDENRVFQMLASLFRIWWEYHRQEHTTGHKEIVRSIEKAIQDITKRRMDWRRHKIHLDELGRWATDLLDESEHRLDNIRNSTKTDILETIVVPDIFREHTVTELIWIKSIMKICIVGGEIEVRVLVELLGIYHSVSKECIRSNIMSLIKDSAITKKGTIKYITGISVI